MNGPDVYLDPADGKPKKWTPPSNSPKDDYLARLASCKPAEDGVCEALECCKHGVGDGACKECYDETARPSQDRRADVLRAQQERDTALLRQALYALDSVEAFLSSMDVTHLLVYGEVDKAISTLKERLK